MLLTKLRAYGSVPRTSVGKMAAEHGVPVTYPVYRTALFDCYVSAFS